ncbi:MAG: cyclase family protein [Clostridia bacterium]|nr:cyclase family protein [Clostridia bacterium]
MDFRIIDITKDLVTTTPYPGDPAPELSVFSAIGNGDACNMAKLFTTLHCGTHADAPLHFIPGGKPINAVETDRFIGECEVFETPPGRITGDVVDRTFPRRCQRLLLKSNGLAYFEKTGAEEAAYLGYKLIGTDSNSIGGAEDQIRPHKAILSEGIAVLENLDLSRVKPGKYFLIAAPIKINGVEAAPVRALLIDGHIFWSN